MSVLVVDASVAAKWYLHEPDTEHARRVLASGSDLHAPDFFLLEVDNILCKNIRRGNLTVQNGDDIRRALLRNPIEYHPTAQLRDHAYALANQTRRSVYDCLYLALAVMLGGQMVTADRRLHESLSPRPLGEHVLWVADVP